MTGPKIPKIRVEQDSISAQAAGDSPPVDGKLVGLPAKYIDWIERGRRNMYGSILERKPDIRFFSQHLPVVVTYAKDAMFPLNCANKGVGFLPKDQYLSEFIELFEETHHRTRNRPWRESLTERLKVMSKFYFDRDKIDYRLVSSLEIFERKTFENLCRTPMASLLYTGDCPDYTSFQLDCVVEIVGPGDPRHHFTVLARTMFEYESFHITQPRFPHAYLFWIAGVTDKTPIQMTAPEVAEPDIGSNDGLRWHDDALRAVGRAPSMIQDFIRESVETYASERGFMEITVEVVEEAKENLM